MKDRICSIFQFLLPLLIALAVPGCEKPVVVPSTTGDAPAATPSPMPVSVAEAATPTPAPPAPATPAPVPAASAPEDDHLAPPGVFFLRSRLSVTTDDGIVGVLPGARAELQSDGRYLVNGRTLAISPEYLTNDMRIAGQAGAQFNATEKAAQVKTSQSPMDSGAAARKANADGAAARTAEAVQARAVAEASAAAEKQRATAEHRQAIAALEAKKKTWSPPRYPYTTHQRFLNEINDDIVKHQQELFRLGVGGASLERR